MAYDSRLAGRIRGILADRRDVSEREKPGGLAFMVRGNYCVTIVDDDLQVRVGPAALEELVQQPHVRPLVLSGGSQPLEGFLLVASAGLDADGDLERWVGYGLKYVISLPERAGGFASVEWPDGTRKLVDQATLDYMESTAPPPTQSSLDGLLDQLAAVRVFANGSHNDSLIGDQFLLAEIADRDSLTALGGALRILDGPSDHCMCYGAPTLELLAPNDGRLALLTVHHYGSLRWVGWHGDARLVDPSQLVAWLADRGIATHD